MADQVAYFARLNACVMLAGIGAAVALALHGSPRRAARERLVPVPTGSQWDQRLAAIKRLAAEGTA